MVTLSFAWLLCDILFSVRKRVLNRCLYSSCWIAEILKRKQAEDAAAKEEKLNKGKNKKQATEDEMQKKKKLKLDDTLESQADWLKECQVKINLPNNIKNKLAIDWENVCKKQMVGSCFPSSCSPLPSVFLVRFPFFRRLPVLSCFPGFESVSLMPSLFLVDCLLRVRVCASCCIACCCCDWYLSRGISSYPCPARPT